MDVRTCRKCGRLFNYLFGTNLCPACKNSLEKDYERTRDYIRDNPGASIKAVADECEVTIAQIEQWVRDGRLEFSRISGVVFTCESCGKQISSGKYCEACTNGLIEGLSGAINKPKADEKPKKEKKDSGNKMRFLKK